MNLDILGLIVGVLAFLPITSVVAASTTSNVSWSTPVIFDTNGEGVALVSCANANFCMTADRDGSVSEFNGSTWSSPSPISGITFPLFDAPSAISCSSPSSCILADSSGRVFDFDGTGWSGPQNIGIGSIENISCVSPTFCMAIGFTTWSTFDGISWSIPASLPEFGRLSCTSRTFCVIVNSNSSSVFNGTGWHSVSGLDFFPITSSMGISVGLPLLSCTSSNYCMAIGTNGIILPGTWPNFGYSINMTYLDFMATFNGYSWTAATLIDDSNQFTQLTCASNVFCLASTASGTVEQFSGISWSPPAPIFQYGKFQTEGLLCPSTTFCMSVGTGYSNSGYPNSYAITLQTNANGPSISSITPTIVTNNTQGPFTITGSNFTGATAVYFGDTPASSFTVNSDTSITAYGSPSNSSLGRTAVSVMTPQGTSEVTDSSVLTIAPGAGPGYYMLGSDGEVYNFGSALFYGDGVNLGSATSMAVIPSGTGYWITNAIGYVDALGTAQAYYPSANPTSFVVSIVSTPDGKGYWLATSAGQVITAGDAQDYGSPNQSNLNLRAPIVNMAATPDGKGYWLLGSDGGVFSYGDANFYGSTGNIKLDKPAIAMTPTLDGKGYWFVASDGGIFAYGDAHFYGSMGNTSLASPVVGMSVTSDGLGYWLAGADGGVFSFGDASYVGSLPASGIIPQAPIDGFAADG